MFQVSPEYIHEIYVKLFSSQVRQTTDFSRPGTAGKTLRDTVAPPMTSYAISLSGAIHKITSIEGREEMLKSGQKLIGGSLRQSRH